MMGKRKILSITATLILLVSICTPASAQNTIAVEVNEKVIDLTGCEPLIQGGKVLYPVRAIGEYIGASVSWLSEKQLVSIYRDGIYVRMTMGSVDYSYGPADNMQKAAESLNVAPQFINGHIMVPIAYVIKAFGGSASWDSATSTVKIKIEMEKRGNALGNHVTGSLAAFSGESIYYCDGEDSKLYRIDPNVSLTSKLGLSDYVNIANINVLNGWVYYTYDNGVGIVRTRTNGESSEILLIRKNGAKLARMQVVGGWIYYNLEDNSGIYRLPISGGEPTLVVNKSSAENSPFCVTYERIYFTNANRESMCVSAVDGRRIDTIGYDFAEYTNVVDGWIYYIDSSNGKLSTNGGTIAKVRIGGGERQYLSELPKAYALNVVDGWMYFYTDSGKALCKSRIDGKGLTQMLDQFDTPNLRFTRDIAIHDNWLYLSALNLQNNEIALYRMKTDNQSAAGIEKLG